MKSFLNSQKKIGKFLVHGNVSAPHRLLIPCDSPGATFYISFFLPLLEDLKKGVVCICSGAGSDINGDLPLLLNFLKPTHLVLSRAYGIEVEQLVEMWKKPYLYQIDDDLLSIPEEMDPEIKKRHGLPAILESRKRLMGSAATIFASTDPLKQLLEIRFPAKKIVSGLYAPYVPQNSLSSKAGLWYISKIKNSLRGNPTTIGYMGSRGHLRDLEMIVPVLRGLLIENPRLRFETFGTINVSDAFRDLSSQFRHHRPEKDYLYFLKKLKGLGWDYGLAPLVDDSFNRCKTPSKFIEYSSAGITTIASDVQPYKVIKNGKTGYLISSTDWKASLKQILEGKNQEVVKQGKMFCETQFSITLLRERLYKVLETGRG